MFTLKMKTDNDAFAEGNLELEVARILRNLATHLEDRSGNTPSSGKLRDSNGNTVGTWVLT